MIPSAKIAKRCREPPLKRLRKPRTFEPWKFSAMSSTASMLMPGAGMYAPTRYSRSIAAVKASFFRMSATRNAFRNVLSTRLLLDQLAGPARGLDLLAGGLREAVGVHGQRLAQVALAEHLDGHVAAGGEAGPPGRGRGGPRAPPREPPPGP